MYYSFNPVEDPNDSTQRIEFIPKQVQKDINTDIDTINDAVETTSNISDEEAFTFLGYSKAEGSITGYYYVVDGIQLVEQPEEINVQALDTLPTEVENDLALNGTYALGQRFFNAITNMPEHSSYEAEHNYAELQAQINDLSTILYNILLQMPATTAEDNKDISWIRALKTLKRNNSINTNIKDMLAKVGL